MKLTKIRGTGKPVSVTWQTTRSCQVVHMTKIQKIYSSMSRLEGLQHRQTVFGNFQKHEETHSENGRKCTPIIHHNTQL